MAAIVQLTPPASSNRRGRVRQKVHVPAYASFSDASHSEMLDLYEVLNISEGGLALHCSWPMEVNQTVELCLDLAEAGGQISGTARGLVRRSWSCGFRFSHSYGCLQAPAERLAVPECSRVGCKRRIARGAFGRFAELRRSPELYRPAQRRIRGAERS